MLPHQYVSASTASTCLCHTSLSRSIPVISSSLTHVLRNHATPFFPVLFHRSAFNIAFLNGSDKQPHVTFTLNSPTPDTWHRITKGCNLAQFTWVVQSDKQEMPGQSGASLGATLILDGPWHMQSNVVSVATNDAIVDAGPLRLFACGKIAKGNIYEGSFNSILKDAQGFRKL